MKLEELRNEVSFSAVSSRGPGGQNVNKVASAALLIWRIASSNVLTEEQKTLIFMKLQNRINRTGELLIRSDEFRDLPRNKERCLEKLCSLIALALHKPKARKATQPTKGSKKRRLDSKSRHSQTKQSRRKVDY